MNHVWDIPLCGLQSMARVPVAVDRSTSFDVSSIPHSFSAHMLSQRAIHLILAVGIGVGTGVYVFQPLLKEYEA